MYVCMVTRLRR